MAYRKQISPFSILNIKIVKVLIFLLTLICLLLLLNFNKLHGFWIKLITKLPNLEVTCPNNARAILVIGQSQASNTGPTRTIAQHNSYMFLENKCYHLRDPMLGTKGTGGSIWPRLADKLPYTTVIANIAISGSAIEQWTTYEQINKINNTITQLKDAGFPNPLVILMQGETNGERKTSEYSYYASLKTIKDALPNLKLLLTRESICYKIQKKWIPLDKARNHLASLDSNVKIGPDIDNIPLNMRQSDQCHLNMIGQEYLASQLANSIVNME